MAVLHVPESAAPIKLSHRTCPTGETVVDLDGELDILSAEVAVSYVRDVIDRHHGPVQVNLTALVFCDANGNQTLTLPGWLTVQRTGHRRLAACLIRPLPPGT